MFIIDASKYAPIDPIIPPCEVAPIFIGYVGENLARCVTFDLTECYEKFGAGSFAISFIRDGDEQPYLVSHTDELDGVAMWNVDSTDTAVKGYGMVQVLFIKDGVTCKSALYRTVTFESNGVNGDAPDPYENMLDQIAAYVAAAQGAAQSAAESASAAAESEAEAAIRYGSPLVAATVAEMTDEGRVYVYTGSETGYVNGNWYYYNGSAWVSGGVYNSEGYNTDTTLSVAGMAADAKATGDEVSELKTRMIHIDANGYFYAIT